MREKAHSSYTNQSVFLTLERLQEQRCEGSESRPKGSLLIRNGADGKGGGIFGLHECSFHLLRSNFRGLPLYQY